MNTRKPSRKPTPTPESVQSVSEPMIRAVDLFCGIGGLTHGLRAAGIDVALGLDIDASCRYAYELNNHGADFWQADIRNITFADIEKIYEGADFTALAGCAPCQPFSAHARRTADNDCGLIYEFARLIREGEPDIVSMENVQGLAGHESFHKFLGVLADLGYKIDYSILDFYQYGVPQRRKRLVLVASTLGQITLPEPSGPGGNVTDFIRNLQPILAGEAAQGDPAHACLPLTPVNLSRIRQSRPGGSWRDWDRNLVNPCHTRRAYYPAPYGRMRWDQPAPTITTQFCYYSTGRFGHPTQDRTISVREAALLQTFPPDYHLVDLESDIQIRHLARHVGNAVPVRIGEHIGKSLQRVAHNA